MTSEQFPASSAAPAPASPSNAIPPNFRPRPIPHGKHSAVPLTRDEEDDFFIIRRGESRPLVTSLVQKPTEATKIAGNGFRFRRTAVNPVAEREVSHDDNNEAAFPSHCSDRDSPPPEAARKRFMRGIQTPIPDPDDEELGEDPQPKASWREQTPFADDDEFQQGPGFRNGDMEQDADEEDAAPEENGENEMGVDAELMRPTMLIESDPSGSDYSDTEKDTQRRRTNQAKFRRNQTPTIEDQDQEDEEEFERVSRTPPSPPRFTRRQKGKGKEANLETHDTDTIDLPSGTGTIHKSKPCQNRHHRSVSVNDEESTDPYSSGPIPSTAKDAAYAAHGKFMEKLEKLAKEYNKPVKHFLSLVGSDVPSTRRLSAWDAYQRWYPVHVKEKPADGKLVLLPITGNNLTYMQISFCSGLGQTRCIRIPKRTYSAEE